MSLLDIGLDAPAPSTNQQQQQQQQQPLDPFGMPQNAPPQRQGPPITFDEPFESSPKPPDEPPPHQAPGAGISDSGADSAQSGLPQGLDFAVFDEPKAAELATQPPAASSDIPASSRPAPAAGSEVGGQASAAESVENAANEAAEAGGAGEAATKARLAEIERLFAGRWRLARSDPFGEYLKAVGKGT
ncbi:hypothetical protein EGW08_014374 [Elysia chlorotica]|uniref:Uncharacterized protein n=1 Tax=Elysia chlorotica TaxID=188477 RepID=A0A433T8F5_ELYCH|nr:hypothetical protein EGW08_014374 [Elysia chlorotica]